MYSIQQQAPITEWVILYRLQIKIKQFIDHKQINYNISYKTKYIQSKKQRSDQQN